MTKRSKKEKSKDLERINENAAGIDIGSRSHYVAVPAGRSQEEVREFPAFTSDLHELARWLKSCGVSTVAMESTGVYWIPVYQVLEGYGFEVKLVDARHAKNVSGRKSDVQDCQWLRDLHTFGLLSGAFIPTAEIVRLRTYWRHREELVKLCAQQIHHMQKSLDLMNLHLHKVISDLAGVSGQRIIRAIVEGQRDAKTLAQLVDGKIQATEEEIVKSLEGNYRDENLFSLRHAVELYDIFQQKITECDKATEAYMHLLEAKSEAPPPANGKRSTCKNRCRFDLRQHLFRITGVDLTLIPAIDAYTAQVIVSECGVSLDAFRSEKSFASWLNLSPNNRITGGRIYNRATRRGHNRVAQALKMAAQSLHRSQTALGAYYRRMRARLGPQKAITAAAHKLARIVFHMLKYGQQFVEQGLQQYEALFQERKVRNLQRHATALGFQLLPLEQKTTS